MTGNKKINLCIQKGEQLLRDLEHQSIRDASYLFNQWILETKEVLSDIFRDEEELQVFSYRTNYMINKFSSIQTKDSLRDSLKRGIQYIKQINNISSKDERLDLNSAIIVVRRILQNFYKHLETMYQSPVHRSGAITKEKLDAIYIGNEYDVQRILYSLIRPIFPEARLEVPDDSGYKSVRYDISLDDYNIVIEVKCTRPTMTERSLTEEIGSDIYHYNSEYLFFFIYDKEKIITNVDAFMKNYSQSLREGHYIEAIVNQPRRI